SRGRAAVRGAGQLSPWSVLSALLLWILLTTRRARDGLRRALRKHPPAQHQHRWGSAGGSQHLLPSVVSWVTRVADVVPDAIGSDHLTAGRAVHRRGTGWPWCRSVDARVGLLSTAADAALPRRAQRVADRRRRQRRRQLAGR